MVVSSQVFVVYIVMVNMFGFFGMWWDKICAIKKRWRQSENSLILLSIIGGSCGVFVSMHLFRHKTHNRLFVVGIPIIIYTQCTLFFAYTQLVEINVLNELIFLLKL